MPRISAPPPPPLKLTPPLEVESLYCQNLSLFLTESRESPRAINVYSTPSH